MSLGCYWQSSNEYILFILKKNIAKCSPLFHPNYSGLSSFYKLLELLTNWESNEMHYKINVYNRADLPGQNVVFMKSIKKQSSKAIRGMNPLYVANSAFTELSKTFRDKVCEECGWSETTFYRKMRSPAKNIISNAEKDKILLIAEAVASQLIKQNKLSDSAIA